MDCSIADGLFPDPHNCRGLVKNIIDNVLVLGKMSVLLIPDRGGKTFGNISILSLVCDLRSNIPTLVFHISRGSNFDFFQSLNKDS